MLLCRDFVKFDVLTDQKCSRDNSKVITFFAFQHAHCGWLFPSYLDHYLNIFEIGVRASSSQSNPYNQSLSKTTTSHKQPQPLFGLMVLLFSVVLNLL